MATVRSNSRWQIWKLVSTKNSPIFSHRNHHHIKTLQITGTNLLQFHLWIVPNNLLFHLILFWLLSYPKCNNRLYGFPGVTLSDKQKKSDCFICFMFYQCTVFS